MAVGLVCSNLRSIMPGPSEVGVAATVLAGRELEAHNVEFFLEEIDLLPGPNRMRMAKEVRVQAVLRLMTEHKHYEASKEQMS